MNLVNVFYKIIRSMFRKPNRYSRTISASSGQCCPQQSSHPKQTKPRISPGAAVGNTTELLFVIELTISLLFYVSVRLLYRLSSLQLLGLRIKISLSNLSPHPKGSEWGFSARITLRAVKGRWKGMMIQIIKHTFVSLWRRDYGN